MTKLKKNELPSFASDEQPKVEFIPEAGSDFVVTPYIEDLTARALAYLTVGYAVHLCGPAGTGKSTLALHIASQLGRPCTLLHGDDEFKASDLLGRDTGYHRSSTVDNYVSSIVKTEETLSVVWSNNRLTTACQKGHTLIYDEFTRSPATANNPFLSILEEGILNIPSSGKQKGYIRVHDDFRAIFTSNPEEYVGVHKTQDALLDRMITMRLDYQDRETEMAIVQAKSQCSEQDAAAIVDIVRGIRALLGGINGPTVRAAIAIARILDFRGSRVDPSDNIFLTTCKDVLCYHTWRQTSNAPAQAQVDLIIRSLGAETSASSTAISPTLPDDASAPVASPTPDQVVTPTQTEKLVAQGPGASDDEDQLQAQEETVEVDVEERLLDTAKEISKTLDDVRLKPEDSLPSSSVASLLQDLNGHLASNTVSTSNALPKPPPPRSIESETASPKQMLEAAVSRFLRPPTTGNAGIPVSSFPTTIGSTASSPQLDARLNGWSDLH